MPKLPILNPGNTSRVSTDVFRGLNHNLKIADGEMYDTENLTSDYFPLLATRKKRGTKMQMTDPGGIISKDSLYYVYNGTLYKHNGKFLWEHNVSLYGPNSPVTTVLEPAATPLTGLTPGVKQLVSTGAYIVIFPDKVYYNTKDPTDYGSIDAEIEYEAGTLTNTVIYQLRREDGSDIGDFVAPGDDPPASPSDGDYWWDSKENKLKQYNSQFESWHIVEDIYTEVAFPSTDDPVAQTKFKAGDMVEISGLDFEELNGTQVIVNVGSHYDGVSKYRDWILLKPLVTRITVVSDEKTITLTRKSPDIDYVCECQNRLWGCYYGQVDGKQVNEIYASALGDFRNWNKFEGLSTDSWAASVGSDGPWTGAINFLGRPCFFKENRIHSVTVSNTGAHRIDETICNGVQTGCSKSLQIVGETLYYKSRSAVCAWQGGFPTIVSAALGEKKYSRAVAGAVGNKYYVSMRDDDVSTQADEVWTLLVYDTAKGIWLREDDLKVLYFERAGNELWFITGDNELVAMFGSEGTLEETVSWAMETGLLYYEYPDKKYLSRYDIRLNMAAGATAKIWMEYDSSGVWVESGTIQKQGTGTVVVPIRPRRCDHLRMKLSGTGDVKIFSVARTLEVGSDV